MSDKLCSGCDTILDRREGPTGVSYQCLNHAECGQTFAPEEVEETPDQPILPSARDDVIARLVETSRVVWREFGNTRYPEWTDFRDALRDTLSSRLKQPSEDEVAYRSSLAQAKMIDPTAALREQSYSSTGGEEG